MYSEMKSSVHWAEAATEMRAEAARKNSLRMVLG